MARLRRLLFRLRSVLRPFEAEPDLAREVDSHLRLIEDDFERQGLTPEQALVAARRRFGSVEQTKDRHRDARSFVWMDDIRRDVGYAMRLLRCQPGFAAIATLTMALGIGTTTTLFSVAYGVLVKPLPWPDADRIVRVTESRKGQQGRIRGTISNGPYLAWREQATTVEALGGYGLGGAMMTLSPRTGFEPARLQVSRLTASVFDVLRARPLRGRVFTPDDERAGSGAFPTPAVIILSYGLWQDWFAGRDTAIGATMRVDDASVMIVGVMPRDFVFPDPETRAWLPMPIGSVAGANGVLRMQIFGAMARLKRGVSTVQAAAEGTSRARTAPDPGFTAVSMFGSNAPPDIDVTPAAAAMTAEVRPAISLLLAAVALLLVTATANVGSLQLAQATVRRRELAVRAAMGAGGARLVRQVIVESGVVGFAGGIAGVALTFAFHRALPALLPADFPRASGIAVSFPVLAFAVAVSFAASIACALLPSFAALQLDVAGTLGAENGASTAGVWGTGSGRLRVLVMAGQVTVACVLLIGSVLLIRSFIAMMRTDRGYNPAGVLTARLDLPRRYDAPHRAAFYDAVIERLQGTAGIRHAAASNALPLLTLGDVWGAEMPSPSNPAIKVQVRANYRMVSPEYFRALGLRLLEGRLLSESDTATSPPVLVVDRTFALRYLGPVHIGAHVPIRFGEGRPDAEVVGVVEDMRQGDVTEAPTPELFASYRQTPTWLIRGSIVFVVRTVGDPLMLVGTLRTAVREQDPTVALDSIMTMDQRVATSLAKPRLYAVLLAGLAIAALAIAFVGLFGVLSHAVAQRSREIGVRTALGAQERDIVALVLRQALGIVAVGLVLGLAAALAGGRLLSAFLYGVGPHDPLTLVGVTLIVIIVALLAAFVPARRAANIDPLAAIRS
jgi:putative ABC transport system permease protein